MEGRYVVSCSYSTVDLCLTVGPLVVEMRGWFRSLIKCSTKTAKENHRKIYLQTPSNPQLLSSSSTWPCGPFPFPESMTTGEGQEIQTWTILHSTMCTGIAQDGHAIWIFIRSIVSFSRFNPSFFGLLCCIFFSYTLISKFLCDDCP